MVANMEEMNKLFDVPVSQKKKRKTRQMSEFTKLKHNLYEQYKIIMKQFGKEKEIVSYRKWLNDVNNTKI